MPIGFAKSVFSQSATAAGGSTTAWRSWDGSNDVTTNIDTLAPGASSAIDNWLGFCEFSDTHGLAFGIKDFTHSNDKIVYRVIKNTSDSLSSPGGGDFVSGSNNENRDFNGALIPTAAGNIFSLSNHTAGRVGAIYSLSGDTATRHTEFNIQSAGGEGFAHGIVRVAGSDVYITRNNQNQFQKITLTDNGNSSSISAATEVTFSGTYYYTKNGPRGFVNANTMLLMASDTYDNVSTNGDAIIPLTFDLTDTGTGNTPDRVFSDATKQDLDMNSSNNFMQMSMNHSMPHFTTDFSDKTYHFERLGSGASNQIRTHVFKSGESDIQTSNTITLSTGTDSDTSFSCIHVGDTDDVLLMAFIQVGADSLKILKYIYSTNTLSEVVSIANGSDWTHERLKLARWGNDRAIMLYDDGKMRLLKP